MIRPRTYRSGGERGKFSLKLQRPSKEKLQSLNGRARYAFAVGYYQERIDELEEWLEEQGIPKSDYRFSRAIAFPRVSMVATPRVARMLERGPQVVSVSPSKEVRVDLT